MIHKILSLFVNTLTVEEKHYLLNRNNLTQTIQIKLSRKEKSFSEFFFFFFFAFLKSILNFEHLSKKLSLIADVYKEISALKNMLHENLKSRVSEDP